ncbi:putative ATP/GTP-binding protein, MmyX [Candidatus Burkholderia humilis]|nr:putative ATP/GTP-binding protein, MmyX [Candidatus Burkholderia humilis]
MKIAVSGTYSSGKTLTVMALSYYTGIPRTLAKAIREIMPLAVPGKRLSEVTPAEFLHLMMQRHVERVVHETRLGDHFVSDGSSLQEWLYGGTRTIYGMNPAQPSSAPLNDDPEMLFFGKVVREFSKSFKRHVKSTYDVFIHLRHELPLINDGHRPMSNQFRTQIDNMLLETLEELAIPYYVVHGDIASRLGSIATLLEIEFVLSAEEAIALAKEAYSRLDLRLETDRASRRNNVSTSNDSHSY